MSIFRRLFSSRRVPVIDRDRDPNAWAGFDSDYRYPGDPPNRLRINQERPKGLPKKVAEYLPVAGIKQEGAAAAAESFIRGGERRLELERDPDNAYDPNAIKVIGHWTDERGAHTHQLGWVPAETAAEIAASYADARLGVTLKTMFQPGKGKGPGIRFDIWGPRAEKKRSS